MEGQGGAGAFMRNLNALPRLPRKDSWNDRCISYTPETTMSYLTQMAGLVRHNFVSAAVEIAIAVAVIRFVAWKESKTMGNFWVDTTRGLLWVLFADMPAGRAGVAGSGAETLSRTRTQR
jgi:hypothetical protein